MLRTPAPLIGALGDMKKQVALAAYWILWAALTAIVIHVAGRFGISLWEAGALAFLSFIFVNGTAAYSIHAKRLRSEGREPPPYLEYVFFPKGAPRSTEEAPRSQKLFVAALAGVMGAFLVYCGVALALDGEFSRIPHPIAAGLLCFVISGIGAMLLYLTWRLLASSKQPRHVA